MANKEINYTTKILYIKVISIIFLGFSLFVNLINNFSTYFFFLSLFFLKIVINGVIINLSSQSLLPFLNSIINLIILNKYLILYY